MAIGRTFKESLQKAVRSLEIGRYGLGGDFEESKGQSPGRKELEDGLTNPNSKRLFYILEAFAKGMSPKEIYELSHIDPWFLHHMCVDHRCFHIFMA